MEQVSLTSQIIAGRYHVHELIGEGAMGSVYRAEDAQLGREVALKVLRREWISRPEVKQRLEHECRLMARLGPHNNIVTLFDRLEFEGHVVLVMEFVPGETLEAVIERTRLQKDPANSRKTTPFLAGVQVISLSVEDTIEIARQCLDALEFAHGRNIVHRDIKPSNILIMREQGGPLRAKVMDFGIGKAVQGDSGDPKFTSLTRVGGPGPGTPAYMAPAQIDPERFGVVGPQADLYAMGITLYEMLALRPPFSGTYTELFHAHTNVEPPDPKEFNSSINPQLGAVLRRALKKTVDQRYPSAAEFRTDLDYARSGTGTLLSGTTQYRSEKPRATGKRGVPRAALAFVGMAALVLVGVAIYFLYPPPPPPLIVNRELPSGEPLPFDPSPNLPRPNPAPESPVDINVAKTEAESAQKDADTALQELNSTMPKLGKDAPNSTAYSEGVDAFKQERWTDAKTSFETAAKEFREAHKNAAQELRGIAAAAEASADQRFADQSADPMKNESYSGAKNELNSGDAAMTPGTYKEAAEHFENATTYYKNAVPPPPPPPPVLGVTRPEAEAAIGQANEAREKKLDDEPLANWLEGSRNFRDAEAQMEKANDHFSKGEYEDAKEAAASAQTLYAKANLTSPPPPPPPVSDVPPDITDLKNSVAILLTEKISMMSMQGYIDASTKALRANQELSKKNFPTARTLYEDAKRILTSL